MNSATQTNTINTILNAVIDEHGIVGIRKLTPSKCFTALYNATPTEVDFDPTWSNGTGYFDNLTDVSFGEGTIVKFTDNIQRRGIIISAKGASVVVFERQKPSDLGRSPIIVSNSPYPHVIDFVDGVRRRRPNVWFDFEYKTNSTSNLNTESILAVLGLVKIISEN